MGEGELKCHRSSLQTFSLPPPSSTTTSRPSSALQPNFHNFQLVKSRREGEQSSADRAWTGRQGPVTEKESEGCPRDFVIYFIVADTLKMLSKVLLPGKGWG